MVLVLGRHRRHPMLELDCYRAPGLGCRARADRARDHSPTVNFCAGGTRRVRYGGHPLLQHRTHGPPAVLASLMEILACDDPPPPASWLAPVTNSRRSSTTTVVGPCSARLRAPRRPVLS